MYIYELIGGRPSSQGSKAKSDMLIWEIVGAIGAALIIPGSILNDTGTMVVCVFSSGATP